MAADVLTYNALQEINQELKAESVGLTSAITAAEGGGGGGGGASPSTTSTSEIMMNTVSPNAGLWCMIPRGSASSEADPAAGGWSGGIKVCDTSQYHRCGCCCGWTVPGGVTCARFQIWGSGGGSGTSCCCGGSPNGGQGAYASVIMPVTSGQTYTLCAGCAYCCHTERAQMTADGCPSYVQGQGLTNFCAEGGESNIFCERKTRCHVQPNQNNSCQYMGGCICNTGTDYCEDNVQTPAPGYPQNRMDAMFPVAASCKTHYGSATGGTVYGIPGSFSFWKHNHGSYNMCSKHPGTYGFPGCSCCQATFSNENGGCCYQACYCQAMCCIPGAGAWGYATCGGDNSGFSDIGKTGMVCVSYC
tara:strand:+ start:776 stop:1855 length:1080 start_codon:yes stop_codon:yes gene_type:complete